MITLALLKGMADAGICEIDVDGFWEQMPLVDGNAAQGIWVQTDPADDRQGGDRHVNYTITVSYGDKTDSAKLVAGRKVALIRNWLHDNAFQCEMDIQPYGDEVYEDVRIIPTQQESSASVSSDDAIAKILTGEIYFKERTINGSK